MKIGYYFIHEKKIYILLISLKSQITLETSTLHFFFNLEINFKRENNIFQLNPYIIYVKMSHNYYNQNVWCLHYFNREKLSQYHIELIIHFIKILIFVCINVVYKL